MSPTPTPDADYISPYPITGNEVTIYPTGEDDYDNIAYAFAELKGVANAQINLVAGTYYSRYQLAFADPLCVIQGAGKESTVIMSGTPTATTLPLDDEDMELFNPSGVPLAQIVAYCEDSPAGSLTLRDLKLSGSLVQGQVAYATQFGSDVPSLRNADVIYNVVGFGKNPNLSVNNFPLTMTGTAPQATGYTNISLPQLRDAPDVGTVVYEEGVDYSVNRAAGTFTRIGSGAITNGQEVYAHFDITQQENEVARMDMLVERCVLTAGLRDVYGVPYSSIENNIGILGGTTYGPDLPGDYQVYHNESYVDLPGYTDKRYSREGTYPLDQPDADAAYETPAVGSLTIRDSRIENGAVGVVADGLESVQTTGTPPYSYLSASPLQSTCTLDNVEFARVGLNGFGYSCVYTNATSGVLYTYNNLRFYDCLGFADFGLGENYGEDQSSGIYLRLADWVGSPSTVDIGYIEVGNLSNLFLPLYLGTFSPEPIKFAQTHLAIGEVPVAEETVSVHDVVFNWLPESIIPNTTRNQGGVYCEAIDRVVVDRCRFVSTSPAKAQAAVKVASGSLTARTCNVEAWSTRPGIADFVVGDGSVNSIIVCDDDNDTVQVDPSATGTDVQGGTIIP